jgi:hypothetical protein
MRVIYQMILDYADRKLPLPDSMTPEKFDLNKIIIEPFKQQDFDALKEKELSPKEEAYFVAAEIMLYHAENSRNEVTQKSEWHYIVDLTPVPHNDN